ncbi:DUF1566 domain-containing protein [uncultured Thiohalocapsa sp.]|jgi:hypothetical protein|uniref:Lcl C-terminal domain-containing protein n=1 Tax=uncultured Thiohalocapsa sp. TaxID=768990 RepID=UPI0025F10E9A|nr:DUF1566 domain-containing protein [uncultured Thiohalocapsa sp.]
MRIPLTILLLCVLATAQAEQRCDTSQHPLSAPTERFTDNGDGTVTDTASGLMWMRCALGQEWTGDTCAGDAETYAWPSTQPAADAVNASGEQFFSDWRVPGLRDLALIVERECVNPRINLTVFPNTAADFFWTSSAREDDPDDRVYALSFGPEGVEPHARSLAHHLRLVRTAQ